MYYCKEPEHPIWFFSKSFISFSLVRKTVKDVKNNPRPSSKEMTEVHAARPLHQIDQFQWPDVDQIDKFQWPDIDQLDQFQWPDVDEIDQFQCLDVDQVINFSASMLIR